MAAAGGASVTQGLAPSRHGITAVRARSLARLAKSLCACTRGKPCRSFGPERLSLLIGGPGGHRGGFRAGNPDARGGPPRIEGPNRSAPILPLAPESRAPHPAAHGHRIDARWVGSIRGFGVSQRSKPVICWAAPGMSSPWRCSSLGRPPLVAQTAAPVGGPSPAQCSLVPLGRLQRSLAPITDQPAQIDEFAASIFRGNGMARWQGH
jgi:hypothetical protein